MAGAENPFTPRTPAAKAGCLAAFVIFCLVMRSCLISVTTPPPRPVDTDLLHAFAHRFEALIDTRGLPRSTDAPYARGKLIVLTAQGSLDYANTDLPAERIATTFEQVSTVVVTRYENIPAGSYDDGSAAFRQRAHLTVIDRSLPAVVGEATLEGSPPPKTITRGKGSKALPVLGALPDGGVAGWVERLPRR